MVWLIDASKSLVKKREKSESIARKGIWRLEIINYLTVLAADVSHQICFPCKSSALWAQEWRWQKLCRLVFALRHRPGTGCLTFGSLPWSSLFRPGYLLPLRNVVVAYQNRVIMMVENLSSAQSLLCYRTPFGPLSMHLWLPSRKIGCISVASPGLSLEHMIGIALSIKMTSNIQSITSSICRLGYVWAFRVFQKLAQGKIRFRSSSSSSGGHVTFSLSRQRLTEWKPTHSNKIWSPHTIKQNFGDSHKGCTASNRSDIQERFLSLPLRQGMIGKHPTDIVCSLLQQ